jgi:hypothetical protein
MSQEGGVGQGEVCVLVEGKSGALEGQLEDGKRAVLRTPKGVSLELTTRLSTTGATREGTYLDQSDYVRVSDDYDAPTLRLYGVGDVGKKARSSAGIFLLLSALLALATAGFAVWFEFAGSDGPSTASVAAKTQRLLAWATEPESLIDPTASTSEIVAARRALDQRQGQANLCLEELRGNGSGPATVGGMACTASSPSFMRDKSNAALFAVALGLLAAGLAALGSFRQFGFGRRPSAG